MDLVAIVASLKVARETAPHLVALFRGVLDGQEPTLEELAAKQGDFDNLKKRRDQIIAEAEARLKQK